jgi:2-C-methyl-D-erythritol 4-phosphate cytidylyltransferase
MARKKLTYALIVAGGKGKRMGKKTPKQFLKISGVPILIKTLLPFERSSRIQEIFVVLPPKFHTTGRNLFNKYSIKKVHRIVRSGRSRQASVYNGLTAMESHAPDIVIIHDAARPLISTQLIDRICKSAKRFGASTAAISIPDTVYDRRKKVFLGKKKLIKIQTPQAFKYRVILDAHTRARKRKKWDFPDDTSLLSFYKKKFALEQGERRNIKITDREDLEIARLLAKESPSLV